MNCLKGAYNFLCGKACCCVGEGVTGQALISPSTFAFLGHATLYCVVLGGSIAIGPHNWGKIPGVSFEDSCSPDYLDQCQDYQLIYRVTLALSAFFLVIAVVASGNPSIHYDWWLIKFGGLPALTVVCMWLPNSLMSIYSYVARYLSFAFLLCQSALVLEIAVDLQDLIRLQMDRAENSGGDGSRYRWVYILLCGVSAVGSLVGVSLMFETATSDATRECHLTKFFISLTLIVGVLATIASMLKRIAQGLLTPCVIFAYLSFLCLYALTSSSCPMPTTRDLKACMALALIIAAVLVVFVSFNGVRMLIVLKHGGSWESDEEPITAKLIPPEEEEGGDTEGGARLTGGIGESKYAKLPPAVFHGLLFLLSLYCAMVLTSWNSHDGRASRGTHDGQAGMWLMVVAQWLTMLAYITVLVIAYREGAGAGDYEV